jgi:polar amino acid transport system substrate-binding protein
MRGLVVLAGACLALAACQESPQGGAAGTFHPRTPHVLTVATDVVPTPGMFEGSASHPTGGFEFGIAQELARRFNLDRIKLVTVPFARLVGGDLGGADVAMALLTPTNARQRVLDFSDPYLDAPPVVLTRAGVSVPDLETARGLRWVIQEGTTLEQIVGTVIQPTRPTLRVSTRAQKLAALRTGRADAALFDFPLGVALATDSGRALHVAAQLETPERIAAAVPKGSGNAQAVSSAIRALVADGTIDALAKKWLGGAASSNGQDIPLLESTR